MRIAVTSRVLSLSPGSAPLPWQATNPLDDLVGYDRILKVAAPSPTSAAPNASSPHTSLKPSSTVAWIGACSISLNRPQPTCPRSHPQLSHFRPETPLFHLSICASASNTFTRHNRRTKASSRALDHTGQVAYPCFTRSTIGLPPAKTECVSVRCNQPNAASVSLPLAMPST